MLRTRAPEVSLWEAVLPGEVLRLPDELARVDALLDDPAFFAPWSLKSGAHEIFTMPKVAVLRSFVMNHMIHHRGQLSVYLRLRNVPLPSIYGPTADEG